MVQRRLNVAGDARTFALPRLRDILADRIGRHLIIQTDAKHRIDDKINGNNSRYIFGLLRNALPFNREWPKAIDCPEVGHPIIFHPALRDKFLKKADTDHIRFAHYGPKVTADPVEVWLDPNDGRLTYNIIGSLLAGSTLHHMIVVAEADNHICDTAYVMSTPDRIETYRRGTLIHAAWKLSVE